MSRRLIAATALAALAGAAGADDGAFEVTLDGAEDVVFNGVCVLTNAAGDERREVLYGAGPAAFTFKAKGIACEIVAEGPLVIEIASPTGNRSRTRTSGGVIKFSQS